MTRHAIIIEDDYIQSIALKLLLGKAGYDRVTVCTTGEMAIKIILDEKPDLIVSDIYLSDQIDGIEVVKRTRKSHKAPAIFITGQSRHEITPRIDQMEQCELLGKPVTLLELRKAIGKLVTADSEN